MQKGGDNTQLLIENPINRNPVNSPMLPDMKKNADGSLVGAGVSAPDLM